MANGSPGNMVRAGRSKAVVSLPEGKEPERRKNDHRPIQGQHSVALDHSGVMPDSRQAKDLAEGVGVESATDFRARPIWYPIEYPQESVKHGVRALLRADESG